MHTPGHAPGAVCFYEPELLSAPSSPATRCSRAGRGATGRSYSDFDTITAIDPFGTCFELPEDTVVHTGHGDDTTIRTEAEGADGWTKPE